MKIEMPPLVLKLAETEAELVSAQRLRYRVFVEEMGAKTGPCPDSSRLERDHFDPCFDHLILIDERITDPMEQVVGVYRLLRSSVAEQGVGYYGAAEFDLTKIRESGRSAVELGRSCIAPEHRGGLALHLLWSGLAQYVMAHDIQILFGTASFHGCNPEPVKQALSHLYHSHLAPPDLRVKVWPANGLDMNILPASQQDKLQAMRQIPPLIKSYLRLGGFVGDGAYIDHSFNTIDVCLLVDTEVMSAKWRAHFLRGRTT